MHIPRKPRHKEHSEREYLTLHSLKTHSRSSLEAPWSRLQAKWGLWWWGTRSCERRIKVLPNCEQSEHSFSKGWGCEIGPNKQSQILLALGLEEKVPLLISLLPLLKMYILVGTMILYVFLQKNRKFEAPFLLNNVNIGRQVHLITRAVENSDAGKASPPLPAVLN